MGTKALVRCWDWTFLTAEETEVSEVWVGWVGGVLNRRSAGQAGGKEKKELGFCDFERLRARLGWMGRFSQKVAKGTQVLVGGTWLDGLNRRSQRIAKSGLGFLIRRLGVLVGLNDRWGE